ncbi:hypothetical protein H4582DRAFT_2074106 [Lactarius indigo]|nr:hypothetical protein H4582DRAFT_2074106 [Lactarius indigo]
MDWIRIAPLSLILRPAMSPYICLIRTHLFIASFILQPPSCPFHFLPLFFVRVLWFAIRMLAPRSDRPARVARQRVHTKPAAPTHAQHLHLPYSVPPLQRRHLLFPILPFAYGRYIAFLISYFSPAPPYALVIFPRSPTSYPSYDRYTGRA